MKERSIFRMSIGKWRRCDERGVAGAEVVDRDSQPERLQLLELGEDGLVVSSQEALRDLERERLGRQPRPAQHLGHVAREVGFLELPDRDVDGEVERCMTRSRELPLAHAGARGLEYPQAQRHDDPGLLRELDELVGREQPPLRVLPAHERLDTDHAPVVELDDRLVVEAEVLFLERPA